MAIRNALVDVGRQIDAVLATAEAAAADIRAQAEQDAERYIEEKRMEANQVFAAQMGRLEQFSRELMTEANRALSPIPGGHQATGNGAPRSLASNHAHPYPMPAQPPPAQPPPAKSSAPVISREEAVLQATQMAIAKKGRTEIEAALRDELGAEESRRITEEVLGSS